ncbi:MAG: pyridoxamine 5'-phosphate oxidase family protein [Bacteroidota bacterium]
MSTLALELLEQAKAELLRSNADRRHPFRFFWLATHGEYPELRTVVQRQFRPDWSLTVFTDTRTPKVAQIREDARVSVLFYHPRKKLQVRWRAQAELIEAGHDRYENWRQQVVQSPSITDYQTELPPGSPLPVEGLRYGEDLHFVALQIRAVEVDVLQLSREQHRRVRFLRTATDWSGGEVVP